MTRKTEFNVTTHGKTLTFEVDKIYYITDWYSVEINGVFHSFPVFMKAICIEVDIEDEGVEFYLKTFEHIIPSDLPLGQYEHPNSIQPDEWDMYFAYTYEDGIDNLYKIFNENRGYFFRRIFLGN